MGTVTIRRATEADVAGLVASHSGLAAEDAATRDPFRNPHWARDHAAEHTAADLADRDKLVLAAVAGADVVGHLLGGFRQWAAERGAEQLRVTAYAANEGAIRFYQRHGFTPLEVTFARAAS